LCGLARADDLEGADVAMASRSRESAAARLELFRAPALPRFDATDPASRGQRVDLSWLGSGTLAIGPTMGLTVADAASPAFAGINLGLHLRHTLDSNYRIDILAWRRVGAPSDALSLIQSTQPEFGARMELNLSNRRGNGLVADRGFIGMQLDSGARITVKKKAGTSMVYYRNQF